MRPSVIQEASARKSPLCNLMAAIKARTLPRTSQSTPLVNSSSKGQRQEASISAALARSSTSQTLPEASVAWSEVGEGALINGYSNWFGFSGALGAGAPALSARAVRSARAATGFL